jgi:hypothetical protein
MGGLFRKKSRLPVAGSIDGDDDRLHMLIAPAFSRRQTTRFLQRL